MQPETNPAAVRKNFSENILFVLLILLAAVFTVQVFSGREYHGEDLVCHILTAILFGMFFGRRREKNSWAFFLAGAGLLGLWSYALIRLNPPFRSGQFFESLLNPFRRVNLHEYFFLQKHVGPYRGSSLAALVILPEVVYLLAWTARFCSARKLGALLRFAVFLTLPFVLLPLSLTLIAPFLPLKSYQYGIYMTPALMTAGGISLLLILTMLVLAILKVRFGWKRLLISYGILILISMSVWGIFLGIQSVRRIKALNRLAAEGRAMTLNEFYARQNNAKDGTEKISELFDMMKNPEFDTGDFPNNGNWHWRWKDPAWKNRRVSGIPDEMQQQERKKEMIRVSEGPLGEKFTAGIADLAQYDHIRFAGNYTDFNHIFLVFNRIRMLVRTGAARAAIAHYTGKTEQILPRLKAVTSVSRLLTHQPWLISVLVHRNLDMILVSQVVSLGPDGPQYADDYRFFLNWIRSQDYTHSWGKHDYANSWGETEISAELLKFYDKDTSTLHPAIRLLFRPLLIETAFYYLNRSLRREKYFAAHHDIPEDDPIREGYRKSVSSKGCLETALALKLYRSLHGKYPVSAAALVPEIVPQLPLDPVTGKPFRYVLKKDHFELFSEDFNRMNPLLVSEPRY